MTLIDRILGKQQPEEVPEPEESVAKERIEGRFIKLDKGWGFIVSPAIPYTRIFFHWSGLEQDTLHFTQLKKGMLCSFEPLEVPGKGIRAIKIKVEDTNERED